MHSVYALHLPSRLDWLLFCLSLKMATGDQELNIPTLAVVTVIQTIE